VRHAAIEVLSEILTFAAFDIPIRLLFLDQAVKLLSPSSDAEIAGMIEALSLYGIKDVFVEGESLVEWGMTEECVSEQVRTLPRSEVSAFIRTHRGVIGV